jgi:hypothetical protein
LTRIDPAAHLASLIRAAATARVVPRKPQPETAGAAVRHAPAPTASSVQALVARQVGAIAVDDPNRRRKAFRVFLEAVLLDQFGAERIGDHGFNQLIDQVLVEMESDPALVEAMTDAADQLLAGVDPSQS